VKKTTNNILSKSFSKLGSVGKLRRINTIELIQETEAFRFHSKSLINLGNATKQVFPKFNIAQLKSL